ncbi:hypothetical protein C8J57DRAFT_1537070 [Mycena rebaudengoi]|nr:hypothetical protein C8J57DRAFT_1540932 [Mycena rebaudengoi]KAJ7219774.1 hypothetical protein C8J57DRAFT_1537070 [Mycena rebaudengoi]
MLILCLMGCISHFQLLLWARSQLDDGVYFYNGDNPRERRALTYALQERVHTIFPSVRGHTSTSVRPPFPIDSPGSFGVEFASQFASEVHYHSFPTPTPPVPVRDHQGRLLVHIALCDRVVFTGINFNIPRYAILSPKERYCIDKGDELLLLTQAGEIIIVKAERNHGRTTCLPFCDVLECISILHPSPACVILLAASMLVQNSFQHELHPNALYLGSSNSSKIIEEQEYDEVENEGALGRAYYREGAAFHAEHIPMEAEFSDIEEDGEGSGDLGQYDD